MVFQVDHVPRPTYKLLNPGPLTWNIFLNSPVLTNYQNSHLAIGLDTYNTFCEQKVDMGKF